MRREKYVFNRQTLQYEKVVEPLRHTLLRIFAIVCAIVVAALPIAVGLKSAMPSAQERLLQQENEELRSQFEQVSDNLNQLSDVVEHLQERDAYVYRMTYRMEPIDENVWQGGIGGHDAYQDLRELPEQGEYVAQLRESVDQLMHQVSLQSKSLDEITNAAENLEERQLSIPSIKPIRADLFSRSLHNLSGFGPRIHPIFKTNRMHWGLDFNCRRGTPVQATGKGIVRIARNRGDGYGNCVVIRHGDTGYETLYAHLSEFSVKEGDEVLRGDQIGKVGSTGQSTGDHLHYEVMLNGQKINPIDFCADGLTPEEYRDLVEAAQKHNQSFDQF
ncbi:MAG: M23 family metallopeptidase [Bacteroidota bacterium]